MNIDRVRYFHVFASTGSLVRASQVLNISQPALSKALRLLENETGLTLVATEGRGLRLTEAGQAFCRESEPLLRQWLNLGTKLKSAVESTPTRIGSFEVFTTHFIQLLLRNVELAALELHELGPGQLEEAIASGRVDLGITYVPIPNAGVEFIEAGRIRMSVFGSKKFKTVPWQQMPFAIPLNPPTGTPSKVMGLDGWPDHKHARLIRYRVTMMESALELCRQGLAVAYLPDFIVGLHNQNLLADFRLQELDSPMPNKERTQTVFLIQRKNAPETPLHRQIAKTLRALE